MKGFRKATEEERAKMLAAMKEEKHYSFNFEKLQPEYTPTVGDVVIVWDDNSKENAVVGVMNEMDKTVRPYKIMMVLGMGTATSSFQKNNIKI